MLIVQLAYLIQYNCEENVKKVEKQGIYWSDRKKCAILRVNREGDDTMEQQKLDRINELARKAKAEGLTPAEEQERATLRAEYIAAYRESLRSQLDSLQIQAPDGTVTPLRKKPTGGKPS